MTPANLTYWALRHGVTYAALHDLSRELGLVLDPPPVPLGGGAHDEAWVQSMIRLEAAQKGIRLFRNNVGALLDDRGVPVRYGLANDSAKLNERLKSSDLIGWRPVVIEPYHVGKVIAQFVSRECKKPGWAYSGTPREVAQATWIQLVAADGGDAQFADRAGTL